MDVKRKFFSYPDKPLNNRQGIKMKPLDGNNNSVSKLTRGGFPGTSAGIGSLALTNNKIFAETISSVIFPVIPVLY